VIERAILTGASGFVGSALAMHLGSRFQAIHLGAAAWPAQVAAADYERAVVFHLAARVHGQGGESAAAFEHDNVAKTRALAEAAAAGGARRLVFLSSVKVLGEETTDRPLRRDSPANPLDDYARSKWAAEEALRALAQSSRMEVTIVRSPLVYGAGVKGNLRALLEAADSPWPLPFGAIRNRRSFIHVDDLARLLVECARAPLAANRTYLAAHPQSVSTRRLLGALRASLRRPARLVSIPPILLEALASAVGQRARMLRLTRSLEVDVSDVERELHWTAQVSFETAVDDVVAAYAAQAYS
jgi:UDP-N-acetyl-alpha-D-quinovosamine dehydrogenase